MLAQQLLNALVLGSVYALFALGFTLVFGVLRVLNLTYQFYFATGAFLALGGVRLLHLPLVAAGALAAVGAGLAAVLVDTALLTRLRRAKAPELASLMVTLGGVMFLNALMSVAFTADVRRFPAAALPDSVLVWHGLRLTAVQAAILAVTALLVLLLFLFIQRSRTGRAIRAVAENPEAAALMGIDVGRTLALVSFLSGLLAGAAGVLLGVDFNAVQPYMGESMMLRGFVLIIIGGLGDIRGALLAGLLLGFLEVMTAAYLSSTYKEAAAFALLVATLWLRPAGLLGRPPVRRA